MWHVLNPHISGMTPLMRHMAERLVEATTQHAILKEDFPLKELFEMFGLGKRTLSLLILPGPLI
jgi:hypothetical protein